jgi:hypothetical protein
MTTTYSLTGSKLSSPHSTGSPNSDHYPPPGQTPSRFTPEVLSSIDEYRARVYPVLVGGGIPFFPQRERRVDLEVVETRTFSSSVVYLHYRVAR